MSTTRHRRRLARQRGAIAVIVGILLPVLLLMAGLVIDLGRLYLVKTELQNAADACALSAARELNDLTGAATERAENAGIVVGTSNRVNLQSAWIVIQPADVTFSHDLALADDQWTQTVQANSVYVKCVAHHPDTIGMTFMRLTGTDPKTLDATAAARLVRSQSFCAIPLAMCTTESSPANNYGFDIGDWSSGLLEAGNAVTGAYNWVRFGGQGAADAAGLIAGEGYCGPRPELVDAEPGASHGIAQAWNTRFGLYAGSYKDITLYPPDRTGYAYTATRTVEQGGHTVTIPGNWSVWSTGADVDFGTAENPKNAWYDYVNRKTAYAQYDPSAMQDANGKPVQFEGNPPVLPSKQHQDFGQDRRMVVAPIIKCADWEPNKHNMPVLDWACALMLHPIAGPGLEVDMEFRGLVSAGACASTGTPGPSGAPIPALVR